MKKQFRNVFQENTQQSIALSLSFLWDVTVLSNFNGNINQQEIVIYFEQALDCKQKKDEPLLHQSLLNSSWTRMCAVK